MAEATTREAMSGRIVPAVLCGGSGTRLWPVSRRDFAKQHAAILGEMSPFQLTITRLSGGTFSDPIVIASDASRFMVADQAREVGAVIEAVLEPEGRDTLAAVTLAACLAEQRDPAAILMVLPSDHLIPDQKAFTETAERAAAVAAEGRIVVLGVTPSNPSTGYGYIEPGEETSTGVREVAAFVEKPDAGRAAELIARGCFWNAGMFCFRVDVGLAEIGKYAPEALAVVRQAVAQGTPDLDALRIGEAFGQAPKISFDHAVMEHTKRAAVIEAPFQWSDIGDWKAVWEESPRDADGVARVGRVFDRDVKNSYVRSEDRLVCVLGLEGVVVIDTPDVVLVAPIDRAQDIKGLAAELDAKGYPEARTPARVHRPWGWYQTMDLGDRFRVKRILVWPGKKLSLQKHHHRAEHWVVVRGTAAVTRDHENLLVRENESIYLPLGCVHRLENPGKIPVEIVEVQTGAYLEEDDIVRVEDDFGRA
jgi:mannose-1-phosphate guanylyltransferase/mannose-6-phosphate isomerase